MWHELKFRSDFISIQWHSYFLIHLHQYLLKKSKKFGTFERKLGLLKYHCFFLEESKRAPELILVLGLFSICHFTLFYPSLFVLADVATARWQNASISAKTIKYWKRNQQRSKRSTRCFVDHLWTQTTTQSSTVPKAPLTDPSIVGNAQAFSKTNVPRNGDKS